MPLRFIMPEGAMRQSRRFGRDDDGAVLVLWGMFLAVAFGFLALAVDYGRVASTQTELQSFADQVALAAAGELDARSDSISRATAAAAALITDRKTFAEGSRSLAGADDYTLVFRTGLPDSDSDAAGDVTTDGRLARFVTVRVNTATVPTPFARVAGLLSGSSRDDFAVAAEATAGMSSWACDVTPLMFCVPDGSWRADSNRGRQIVLRAGGQGAAWGPGNFGFLDPTTLPVDDRGPCARLNGAGLYRCLVGAERAITRCLRTDGRITTQPGQRVGLAEAFNTRFDLYPNALHGYRTNANYRPAPNTVQGTVPRRPGNGNGNNPRPACRTDTEPSPDTIGLPRDTCILTGTCGRFGDGNWDRTRYVTINHGGRWPTGTDATSSRYAMYLAEIADAERRAPPNDVPLPGRQETGAPQCHESGPTDDPERRTVVAAAVDCTSQTISGNTSGIVPLEYVQLFMTEPVAAPGGEDDAEIMVEVVRSAGGFGSGATAGSYREIVQLYR